MQYVRIDNNFVFNNCYRRGNAKPVVFSSKNIHKCAWKTFK